jgi:hypothetical protein
MYMKRKGFYIKKSDKGIYLNIFKADFVQYINEQDGEWIKFNIYEKDNCPKGFTHNMELIQQRIKEDSSNNNTDTTIL